MQEFLASAGAQTAGDANGGGGASGLGLPPLAAFEAEINKYRAVQEEIQVCLRCAWGERLLLFEVCVVGVGMSVCCVACKVCLVGPFLP